MFKMWWELAKCDTDINEQMQRKICSMQGCHTPSVCEMHNIHKVQERKAQ